MPEHIIAAGRELRLEMRERLHAMSDYCTVEMTAAMVGGKGKLVILEYLMGDTHRFGALRKRLPGATSRVLTRQLRELESCGLIRRTEYEQKPLRVDYSWYRMHVLCADADLSTRLPSQPRAE